MNLEDKWTTVLVDGVKYININEANRYLNEAIEKAFIAGKSKTNKVIGKAEYLDGDTCAIQEEKYTTFLDYKEEINKLQNQ